ncbi:MAG: hypothetical protein KDD53_08980, partial [Bdellovibrionales bacterium]|nr:hypothetical protein [Bdellovibrionales bacterium]
MNVDHQPDSHQPDPSRVELGDGRIESITFENINTFKLFEDTTSRLVDELDRRRTLTEEHYQLRSELLLEDLILEGQRAEVDSGIRLNAITSFLEVIPLGSEQRAALYREYVASAISSLQREDDSGYTLDSLRAAWNGGVSRFPPVTNKYRSQASMAQHVAVILARTNPELFKPVMSVPGQVEGAKVWTTIRVDPAFDYQLLKSLDMQRLFGLYKRDPARNGVLEFPLRAVQPAFAKAILEGQKILLELCGADPDRRDEVFNLFDESFP